MRRAWVYAGPSTHRNEREGAARVYRDVNNRCKVGSGAHAVAEGKGTAAGDRDGRPVGDVDTADAVVISIL